MAKNLADLCMCSSALWKVDFMSNDTDYLAEETSKENVESSVWLLLITYTKMSEERRWNC